MNKNVLPVSKEDLIKEIESAFIFLADSLMTFKKAGFEFSALPPEDLLEYCKSAIKVHIDERCTEMKTDPVTRQFYFLHPQYEDVAKELLQCALDLSGHVYMTRPR